MVSMPRLARPDGAEIHWNERGSGPLVVTAFACLSSPDVFEVLLEALAERHRVVVYDPRGTGASSRQVPIDSRTDDDDLEALLEELGPPAVLVGTGDACNRAVRVGARRPDLVTAVLTPGGNPIGRDVSMGTDGLAASDSVIGVLLQTIRTDYRAGLRTAIGTANVQLDEDDLRRRVDVHAEYADHDATVARLEAWIEESAFEEALRLGDRLWILEHGQNPWFLGDIAARTRAALPAAHVEDVPEGPLSRPDITVGYVTRITGAAATSPPHADRA